MDFSFDFKKYENIEDFFYRGIICDKHNLQEKCEYPEDYDIRLEKITDGMDDYVDEAIKNNMVQCNSSDPDAICGMDFDFVPGLHIQIDFVHSVGIIPYIKINDKISDMFYGSLGNLMKLLIFNKDEIINDLEMYKKSKS